MYNTSFTFGGILLYLHLLLELLRMEKQESNEKLRDRLSVRIHQKQIEELCLLAQGTENDAMKEELYCCAKNQDVRVAYNSLWIFSHFSTRDNCWLFAKHDELIDMVMQECHVGKKRLLLTILERQPFDKENIRTDFLDYSLEKMMSPLEPYAVRAFCIKLAYLQCRHYPELLEELKTCLDAITVEPLSAGLKSASRKVWKAIKKDESNRNY
jgi:hypothetical protein